MVAGPKGVPIIGALALLLLCGSACGFPAAVPSPSPTAQVSPHVNVSSSPTPVAGAAVFTLPPQGLRLHTAPGRDAPEATTVRQGVQLDVSASQVIGTETWINVKAHDKPDVAGWALKDPALETETPVDLHFDTTVGYSILFPKGWKVNADTAFQQSFLSPAGDSKLVVQVAADLAKLPPVPTTPGQSERQEGPVEVYGKSPVITFYKLDGGGYELAVRFLWMPGRAFQILLRQPASDSTLFKQVLVSAIIQ